MLMITAKEAREKLDKLPDNVIVFLDVINVQTLEHETKRTINNKEREELIDKAKKIQYRDNDFFGNFLLNGIKPNNIHSILFPQLE